jgi:hypothetical protein
MRYHESIHRYADSIRTEKHCKRQKAATDCTNFTDPIMLELGEICAICGEVPLSFLILMSSILRAD